MIAVSTAAPLKAAAQKKIEGLGPVLRQGWPLVFCDGKIPTEKQWADNPPAEATVIQRVQDNPNTNVGLILGARSGVIDVEYDEDEGEAQLAKLFGGEIPRTPSYTASRGPHRLFAVHPRLEEIGKGVIHCGKVEFRLGGGGKMTQSILPPCKTGGFTREWIVSPDDCELAQLPEYVADKVIAASIAEDREQGRQDAEPANKGGSTTNAEPANKGGSTTNAESSNIAEPTTNAEPTSVANVPPPKGKPVFVLPGRDLEKRAEWADILTPHGWAIDHVTDGVTYWTRPGKDCGTSATTGYCKNEQGKDYLYVFTTNAHPFEPDRGFDKFKAYAMLNHGGNFSAAASALSAAGYGRTLKADKASGELVELASDFEFFHTADDEAYASVPVNGHVEHYRINDRSFKLVLQRLYYLNFDKAIHSNGLAEAIGILQSKSLFEGPEREVFVRVGQVDGKIYLDLGDESWGAVEITADGWRVISNPPIKFRRPKGMLPLPVPQPDRSINELKKFIRVADDGQFKLLVAGLLAAMRGVGPYPVTVLHGEHGSAKSTTARICRLLVDPNIAPLRAEPENGRDFIIAASNGLLTVFDNMTSIKPWMSDALCRLATGGGYSTRELYANCEEAIFDVQRPTILTGINNPVMRSDLLDRAILIELPVIGESERRPEGELWAEFEAAWPYILGALCDAVSAALRNLPATKLNCLPRMADFALWATAAEPALNWEAGSFMAAYSRNRGAANQIALESPVGQAVLALMVGAGQWEGSATELHKKLTAIVGDSVCNHPAWPKDGARLSSLLTELAPNLREVGICVAKERTEKARLIRLSKNDAAMTLP